MPSSRLYRSVFYLFTAMLCLTPMQLFAQSTGAIGGSVRSTDGTLLRGVELIIEGTDKSALSGNDGAFVLTGVAPGRYRLTARSIGYAQVTREIDVIPNRLTRLEIALSESAVELSAITVLGVRRYGAGTSNAAMKMGVPVLDVPVPGAHDIIGDRMDIPAPNVIEVGTTPDGVSFMLSRREPGRPATDRDDAPLEFAGRNTPATVPGLGSGEETAVAALTHGHPSGYLSAGFLALARIFRTVGGKPAGDFRLLSPRAAAATY